ncbi:hypothetical protein [Rhizobium oryzicola]|uniref:Uncharacterized protein n=1 Tax=Rhizobium oryzicola TaxID=1232668 RepID=A0ABT8SYX1_9HYPH|nr:hypothetical protein [Rhizobium oryzicola]MDO1583176.1 hypothetical protein [Rhizobium oryzicola]
MRWLKSLGSPQTISGGYVLTLETSSETYQKGAARKDASGNYVYDNYGRPVMDYTTQTRTVEKVAITQVEGLIPSAGQKQSTIPYYNLPGSSSGGDGALNRATADALFPVKDGLNTTMPVADRPPGFDVKASDLTTDDAINAFGRIFNTWHSSYQVEWVNANLKAQAITNGVLLLQGATTSITYVASVPPPANGTISLGEYSATPRIYQVNTLTKDNFATMPTKDQERIVATEAFKHMASSLGLSVNKQQMIDAANVLRGQVTNYKASNRKFVALPPDAQQAFTDQIDLLISRLDKMSVFSQTDIQSQLTELQTRFNRLAAFFNVSEENWRPGAGQAPLNTQDLSTLPTNFSETWLPLGNDNDVIRVPKNVVSLDDNATINSGYNVFLQQEMRIRDMKETRASVAAGDGYMNGKKLDAPSMIYYFQSQYNLEGEAKVTVETEEVKQQNAYLKTISVMQELINKSIAQFQKADEGPKSFAGLGPDFLDNLAKQINSNPPLNEADIQTLKAIFMFSDKSNDAQKNPLEVLRGLSRPRLDLVRGNISTGPQNGGYMWDNASNDLQSHTHPQWSNYGTQLSELVTLVNQESQLKMNDINSLDRERNRHFDLANSALQKMADLLQNISQAT